MASKIDKFLQAINVAKSDIDRYFIRNVIPTTDAEALSDPYTNVAMCYTCISTTARAISQVPIMVTQKDRLGNNIPVGDKHPWQQLIDKPNYMMSRSMFIENILSFWLLDGNVCIIPFPINSIATKSTPDSLWVVRWKFMKYEKDDNGHIKRWIYTPSAGAKGIELAPSDVLHLRFFNPNDTITGMAPHEAGKIALRSNYRAGNYNAQFFENGAVPGGILQTDKQLSKATFDRTKAQVNQEYGVKQGNAYKMMVLEQGLKWAARGITQRDMEFIELYRLSQEEIMQIYGMKKVIVSANTGGANRATAQVEKQEWWHGTCMPLMRNMSEVLSWGLFEFRNLQMKMTFDISSIEALAGAFAEKAKTAEVMLRLGFTRNEVNERLELGFPKVPWGDVAYMPVNMMPVNLEGGIIQPGGHGGTDGDNPNPNDPQNNPGGDPQEPDKPPTDENADDEKAPKALSPIEHRVKYVMETLKPLAKPHVTSISGKIKRYIFTCRSEILKVLASKDENGEEFVKNYDFQPTIARIRQEITTPSLQLYSMASSLMENKENEEEQTILREDIVNAVQNIINFSKESLLVDFDAEKAILTAKTVFNRLTGSIVPMIWTEIEEFLSREIGLMESGVKKNKKEEKPSVLPMPEAQKIVQPIQLNITMTPDSKPQNKNLRIIRDSEGFIERVEQVEE